MVTKTFSEIGRDYAAEVRAALQADEGRESVYLKKADAHEQIDPASLRNSQLVSALKKIANELETYWKVDDKPLSDAQKDEILRQAGIALGLENPEYFSRLTKGASNDAYMQMTTYISALLPRSGSKT